MRLRWSYNVSLPIVEAVNEVLFDGADAREVSMKLLMRDRTAESENLQWNE